MDFNLHEKRAEAQKAIETADKKIAELTVQKHRMEGIVLFIDDMLAAASNVDPAP